MTVEHYSTPRHGTVDRISRIKKGISLPRRVPCPVVDHYKRKNDIVNIRNKFSYPARVAARVRRGFSLARGG